MKKEVLLAILIGFGLGLTITYGIYRLRTAFEDKPASIEQIVNASPSPSPESRSVLSIHSPEDGSIQEEKSTTVAGTTIPNSVVVLFVNNQDYIQTTDASGNFSFEVALNDGSNVLITHVIDENGQTVTQERTVIVSTLYSDDPTATPSAETTSEKKNDEDA